ncbi:MAG: hypothetical protein ACM31C_10400 [Acidobacteriota bacterium]
MRGSDDARWAHLAAVLGFVGRLHAIRHALGYDLRDLALDDRVGATPAQHAAWARLWHTNMAAWKLAALA